MRRPANTRRYACAVATVALVLGAFTAANTKPRTQGVVDGPIEVFARRIEAFDPAHPEQRRFGRLEFRGGLVLTSASKHFGGWSALALDDKGRGFLSISDTGVWLTGEIAYDGSRPTAITDARLGPLLEAPGQPIRRKRDQDSEGLAVVSGTVAGGEALISFEGNHRIGRFPISRQGVGAPIEFLSLPADVGRLNENKSLESVCQLKAQPEAGREPRPEAGREARPEAGKEARPEAGKEARPEAGKEARPEAGAIVTLAERFPSKDGQHVGWLRQTSGWMALAIANIDGYDLTDCHGLADGGMLVLERRFHWRDMLDGVHMRLRYFGADEIASRQLMRGEVLIEAGPNLEIDNMEGLAVHPGADGESIITMISDDNFNHRMQRTVLLQFGWRRTDSQGAAVPRK